MEQVILTDKLPENWTYSFIQPKLIEKYLEIKNGNKNLRKNLEL